MFTVYYSNTVYYSILYVHSIGQSVTKIMGKTAIWTCLCFYPLPPLNNVEKQRAKLASIYVIGSQNCIGEEGEFQTHS